MKIRAQIEEKYKWDLSAIVADESAFETRLAAVSGRVGDLGKYRGKLGDADALLKLFKESDALSLEIESLYSFAHMRLDENTKDTTAQGRRERVLSVHMRFSSENAFLEPELSALPETTLQAFIADKRFSAWDRYLKGILRQKAHILSEAEEKLLAESSQALQSFHTAFTLFDNADITFEDVTDEKGEKRKLSHASYASFLQSPKQSVRKEAFEKYYASYKKCINTVSAIYAGNVAKDCFHQRARKFGSCLEMALFYEDVEPKVYENLIKCVSDNLAPMHDYIRLRKELLGVPELHMYDLHVPVVEDAGMKLSYDDAYALCAKALGVLGEEYITTFWRAHDERWIDVYENEGKRSGAYSTSVYNVHPYALLNYEETTHDVFTIAHEMGHSMHSFYSNANQPYAKADYTIFVAEVASTVNETLLLKYLLKNESDEKTRKFLLSYYLDMFRTTMYRQTMFSEFEAIAHGMCEKNEPLNVESLSSVYYELNKKYYGDGVISDEDIRYEWARIPHFYTSFYVYKYATGLISAVNIANRILEEGQPAVEDYFKFLKGGRSLSPVELLKLAGVDLLTETPFRFAAKEVSDTLAALKKL